jgi:hypothetical protein
MTWEEMMSPFFGVIVKEDGDASKVITSPVLFTGGAG